MRVRVKVAAFGLLALMSASGQTVTTIQDNGPSSNRVDVVVVGDGYTAAELPKFQSDAQSFVLQMFTQDPYREYRRYFNVHRVDVASAESGADHPERSVFRNTAFDATYNCSGIQRLICVDTSKVFMAVNGVLAPDHRDVIVIIVNDTEYGGSGGSVAVASIDPGAVEIVLHELGHTIGFLADEYGGSSGPSCSLNEPSEANATAQTSRAFIKWLAWIDASTPVPTFGTSAGLPGLYEGAKYCDTGLYRSTYNSKMRSLGFPFEQVNTEQLVLRFYNWVSPIDGSSPAGSVVPLLRPAIQLFSITPTQPLNPTSVSTVWTLDGATVSTGNLYTVSSAALAVGSHTLVASVRDATAMVRNDPSSMLAETRSWTINVSSGPPAVTSMWPPNGTTGLPNYVRLSWSSEPTSVTGYNIYFGATNPPPLVVSATPVIFLDRPLLTPGATYYWKIEAFDGNGTGASPVVSFSVSPIASGPPVTAFRLTNGAIRLSPYGSNQILWVGGSFSGQPAIAMHPVSGNVTVAARDNFGSIYASSYHPLDGGITALSFLGGQAAGPPAAAVTPSDQAYLAIRDNSGGSWIYNSATGWVSLGGVVAIDPALAACPDGSLYLITKDQWNGLWSNRYIPGVGPQGWRFGGGIVPGAPAAACGNDNAAYVAVRDSWGGTWMARVAGNTWTGWYFGAGKSAADPRIASAGSKMTVLIIDQWGGPYSADFATGTGNGWTGWSFLAGIFSEVSPTYAGGDLFIAAEAAGSKHLYWYRKSAPGWTYVGLGPTIASGLSTTGR